MESNNDSNLVPGMDSTSLNLLTRDGALAVTFLPALTARQYAELYDLALNADTADQLSAAVRTAAGRWGANVTVDLPLGGHPTQESKRR